MEIADIPDLSIPDLSWRVRVLQAETAVLRQFCVALVATHPSSDGLWKALEAFQMKTLSESLELEALRIPGSDPSPEDSTFVRETMHELIRQCREFQARASGA